jgi:hypothetical protein
MHAACVDGMDQRLRLQRVLGRMLAHLGPDDREVRAMHAGMMS